MTTPRQRLERTLQVLHDELDRGLRSFHAARAIHARGLESGSSIFTTFHNACIDETCLVLSRMVIVKGRYSRNESVNLNYLLRQVENHPGLFRFAKPGEIGELIKNHARLLEAHRPLLDSLEERRDHNLAHLDRKNINTPQQRTDQREFDLAQIELLYQGLARLLDSCWKMHYGSQPDRPDWQTITEQEIENLDKTLRSR
jgi:hypothetical protein